MMRLGHSMATYSTDYLSMSYRLIDNGPSQIRYHSLLHSNLNNHWMITGLCAQQLQTLFYSCKPMWPWMVHWTLFPSLYLARALSAFFTLSWTCSAVGFLCFKFLVNSWTSELDTASSLPAWYISSAFSLSTLSISCMEKIIAYR